MSKRLDEIKARLEKAKADKSLSIRIPTWITAGDGRDFLYYLRDDIDWLIEKLEIAQKALEFYATKYHSLSEWKHIHIMDSGVIARKALEEIKRNYGNIFSVPNEP